MEMLNNADFWIGLVKIIWINIILSGDNAVVIALAARSLPPEQQKKAIAFGSGAAVVLQVWNFQAFNGYALLGVISSFCTASAYTCIGRLTEKGGHSGAEIVFYFQIYSMIGGALLMAGHMVMPSGVDWVWIFFMSLSALFAQVALTWGCTHIPPVIVTFAMYTGILFHILAGWFLWGERLTLFSWTGGAVIVFGSAMLLWKTRKS